MKQLRRRESTERGEMKAGSYETRKEQIEKEFARDLRAKLKSEGVGYLNHAQRKAIRDALRYAAMVGASEERYRILTLMRNGASDLPQAIAAALRSRNHHGAGALVKLMRVNPTFIQER